MPMADDRMDISVRAHDPADVEFTQLPSSREVAELIDSEIAASERNTENELAHLADEEPAKAETPNADPAKATGGVAVNPALDCYALKDLMAKDSLPANVNLRIREEYLSVEEFTRCFECEYSDFKAKPEWKQQQMKKKVGLF
jgi:hypothetical protein